MKLLVKHGEAERLVLLVRHVLTDEIKLYKESSSKESNRNYTTLTAEERNLHL